MAVKTIVVKNWSGWIRASDGYFRSDDPLGIYGGTAPALPTSYVTRTYSLPVGGTTWTATSSGSSAGTGTNNATGCGHLYAFANCVAGDVIVLTKTVIYTPVQLRNLAGSTYVYVISDTMASLPAAGTRVAPADAANMPIIEGVNATGAIYTATGAHHYRFCGIEIRNKSTDQVYSTIQVGNGETSDATAPHHILFDRCYIHGRTHATIAGRRGMYLTGATVGAFDCYISNYYENGADSQAILFAYGAGPFVCRNNFLQAASENVMLGGVDPPIANSIASDVEIVHNTFDKPTAWIAAGVGEVKNLFESKGGRRVLFEGNILQNCWYGTVGAGQNGFAIVLTHRNQDGGAPWMNNTDFTIRYNKMTGTGAGIVVSGRDSNYLATSQIANRISITNNQIIADGNSTGGLACAGWGFMIGSGPDYLTISHNTIICYKFPMYVTDPGAAYREFLHFTCQNNVFCGNGDAGSTYDLIGDGKVGWNNLNGFYFLAPTFDHNAIVFATLSNYTGTGNIAPASTAAMLFTNFAGAVYSLQAGSPGHNTASDGTDMGADYTALNTAIS